MMMVSIALVVGLILGGVAGFIFGLMYATRIKNALADKIDG